MAETNQPTITGAGLNAPSKTDDYLRELVELNQLQLRELRLMNHILSQNGAPVGDELDALRADPQFHDFKIGS